MVKTILKENSTINDVIVWLEQNIPSDSGFTPHNQNIPQIKEKGIYFWYLHPKGYAEISKFVRIERVINGPSKIIDGISYDLVYIGTTGTGKKGKSNLALRLNWHINNKHTVNTICQKNSALSTLRTGLSALLADDLILPETENLVNRYMLKYLKVYWIIFPDDHVRINSTEKTLIKSLRPLFNLKQNPNGYSRSLENPTRIYKIRRKEVESKTKQRLGMHINQSKKSESINQKRYLMKKSTKEEQRNCVEFKVERHQNIAEVADKIIDLPVGPCYIELFSENDKNVRTYINGKTRKIITSKRKVSDYFRAPDTRKGNIPKFQIVQNEMNDIKRPIRIITVLVYVKK